MKKLTTSLFVLLITMVPGPVSAAIRVTISDGTNTRSSTNQPPGFDLSSDLTTTGTVTLNLLVNCTSPCTRHFPSGNVVAQPGDTFRFQDISATSRARIIKTDSSTDRLELKGVKITSLTGTRRTLTFTFETQAGDFTQIQSSSGSYPFSVALVGSFKGVNGQLTTSCPNPATLTTSQLQTPCAKLLLQVNGITANGSGPSGIATASIPCKNGTATPCATSGGSYSSTGSFSATDSSSISCGTTCSPVQKATLTATFNALNQTLTSANSGIGALSNFSDENFGFVELSVALANELGGNQWVPPYSAGNELYRAVPLPPLTNVTHGGSGSTIPLKFGLQRGELVAAQETFGIKLLSIGANEGLSGTDLARYLRSYASFVPTQPEPGEGEESGPSGGLRFGDITTLKFMYDIVTGNADSGDRRLGDLLFNDCVAGSIRVEIDLIDPYDLENIVGPVIVYLGSNSYNDFKSDCVGAGLSDTNLVDNLARRVDLSFLDVPYPPDCCVKFQKAQYLFGDFFVRSISFVVDQGGPGSEPPVANYRVDFLSGQVNDFTTAPTVDGFALFSTENFTPIKGKEFPTDGVSMKIFKLTGVSAPTLVFTVPSEDISINGNHYQAHVKKSDLQPEPGQTTYRVELCLFGGRCISDQGFMTLK